MKQDLCPLLPTSFPASAVNMAALSKHLLMNGNIGSYLEITEFGGALLALKGRSEILKKEVSMVIKRGML